MILGSAGGIIFQCDHGVFNSHEGCPRCGIRPINKSPITGIQGGQVNRLPIIAKLPFVGRIFSVPN